MFKKLLAVLVLMVAFVGSASATTQSFWCVVGSVTQVNSNQIPTIVDQYPCVTRSIREATCKAHIVSILGAKVIKGVAVDPASTWSVIPTTVSSSLSCVETYL